MKKEIQKIKKIKRLEKRVSARNTKIISKIFLEFSEKIATDNSKKFTHIEIKIDYEWLKSKLKSSIEQISLYTFKETSNLFRTLYNKPLKDKQIKGIKDYFLKKWSKKNTLKQAKNITETTRKALNKIITEGQEIGISHNEMVLNLISEVKEMSKQRASTIARTETSKSINTTSYESAKKVMKEKCWIHVGGKKMNRLHHQMLHGKWVDIDHKWSLKNGVEASYPHEEGLPASEVVRCSCLVIFR